MPIDYGVCEDQDMTNVEMVQNVAEFTEPQEENSAVTPLEVEDRWTFHLPESPDQLSSELIADLEAHEDVFGAKRVLAILKVIRNFQEGIANNWKKLQPSVEYMNGIRHTQYHVGYRKSSYVKMAHALYGNLTEQQLAEQANLLGIDPTTWTTKEELIDKLGEKHAELAKVN